MVVPRRELFHTYIVGDEAIVRHTSAILEKALAVPLEEFERDYLEFGLELLTRIEHGLRGDDVPASIDQDIETWRANIAYLTWSGLEEMPGSGEEAGDRIATYRTTLAAIRNGERDRSLDGMLRFFKAYQATIRSKHSI